MASSNPLPDELLAAYEHIFDPNTALSKLKDEAFAGRLFSYTTQRDSLGIPGRSMAWKLFLLPAAPAPLSPSPEQTAARPPWDSLRRLRNEFVDLALKYLRTPDGSYEEQLTLPGVGNLPRMGDGSAPDNLELNNPLSLHENSPWNDWFTAVDLRKTIAQDVQRTFPDYDYFRDAEVQTQLTQILYIYSVMHPDIGYRQGMHELLAPIYHAIDFDSLQREEPTHPGNENEGLRELCAREWVQADAWSLFSRLMNGMRSWYEWRETTPPALPAHLSTQYRHGDSDAQVQGQGQVTTFVAPIVTACQKLQAQMLKAVDPLLWSSMQKAGVEPQIYGIRWLRLLFTREFSLEDSMILWDGLFSCDDPFSLVPWVCIAMLVRIRTQLIPADYSTQLMRLLRYPTPPPNSDPSIIHHATLLLRQAFALSLAPNPSTGSSLAIENRNLLQIPLEVSDPSNSTSRPGNRRRASTESPRKADGITAHSPGGAGGISSNGKYLTASGVQRQAHQGQAGVPETLARGIFERGESLGINRTVMNAVSEIRKSIPDFTSQILRSPSASEYPSFPLVGDRSQSRSSNNTPSAVDERPPWEHRTRLEMEAEIARLRNFQRTLGDAVARAVDTLLQDDSSESQSEMTSGEGKTKVEDIVENETEKTKKIKERKREAVECLAHVRDLLQGSTNEVDEVILYGEDEYRKRQALKKATRNVQPDANGRQKRSSEQSATDLPTPLKPPEPAAVRTTTPPSGPSSSYTRSGSEHRRQKSTPDEALRSYGLPSSTLSRPPHIRPTSNDQPSIFSRPFTPPPGALPHSIQRSSPSPSVAATGPSAPQNEAMQAPWNYTKSSFSSSSIEAARMPRYPPRSSGNSTVANNEGRQKQRKVGESKDPLGAL